MPNFFTWGNRPTETVAFTTECNECVAMMAALAFPQPAYDTERDARATFDFFAPILVPAFGTHKWVRMWNTFSCRNPECSHKVPCGNGPTWVRFGALQDTRPNGTGHWHFYIELAREIMCTPEAGTEDIRPEYPPLPQPPRQEQPYPLPQPDMPFPPPEPEKTEPMEFKIPGTDVVFVGDFRIQNT